MAKKNAFSGETKYIIHLIKNNNLIEIRPMSFEVAMERLQEEKQNPYVKNIYIQEVTEIV
jgi:hypothetical protein